MILLTKKEMNSKIGKLATREKVTKVLLGELSREMLDYVYETADIAMVNRLISVLTPINKKVAVAFFTAHVGWTMNAETCEFGKKQKDAPYTKKAYLADTFLDDELNTIWTWAEKSIDVVAKPKNYGTAISKLVNKALSDADEGIELKEVLFAIMSSDSVSLADMMKSLQEVVAVKQVA